MPRFYPVIRVFISSTFSDLKVERNYLQKEVFPELEQLCRNRQFQFQAIDLRWGVPGEAGLDHRTMRICFDELCRAQDVSPRPNFLVLLGNRYGWRPLPEEIMEAEFRSLEEKATAPAERAILRTWYRRDENAVPPVYALRSRRDRPSGENRDLTDNVIWGEVEGVLWEVINRAFPTGELAGRFADIPDSSVPFPSLVRFQTSATEQEIWRGALAVPDAPEHVVAWFREIQPPGQFEGDPRARDFFDTDARGRFDPTQQAALSQLKAGLAAKLGGGLGVLDRSVVGLRPTADGLRLEATGDHLEPMCQGIARRLKEIIGKQIDDYWHLMPTSTAAGSLPRQQTGPSESRQLELERLAHERFGNQRAPADQFVGRNGELVQIANYLNDAAERRPLVVHGPSGVGKTSVLARAAGQVSDAGLAPVVRYLGTTPQSSDLRGLLSNLCRQLRAGRPSANDLSADLRELEDELYSRLATATADRPLVLFLDALDQLDEADGGRKLGWLRTPLPPYVKLVVSCISGVGDQDPLGEPYRALQRRNLLQRAVPVESLAPEEALPLVGLWLDRAVPRRTLTARQREAVAQRVQSPEAVECRRPLYLRILFEECRLWPSYQVVSAADIGETSGQLLDNLLNRLSMPAVHGPIVRHALGYLAAARRGLTENELLEVLWQDQDYKAELERRNQTTQHQFPPDARRIPIAVWARLRHDVAPYLSEHSAPGGTVLTFYHRQLADCVRARVLDSPAERLRIHERLAAFFDRQDSLFEGRPEHLPRPPAAAGKANVRKAEELPWQRLQMVREARAGNLAAQLPAACDRLEQLFENIGFLEAKTKAGLIFELASEFTQCADALPDDRPQRRVLRLLDEALRRDIHFIARHKDDYPQALFQCLWESCWWYDCPSCEKHYEPPEGGWPTAGPPWKRPGPKLHALLESWRADRQRRQSDFAWARSLRPPTDPLGCARRSVLTGHGGAIQGIAFYPDGRRLASVSTDGTLRIWNTESGQELARVASAGPLSCVALSPDGIWLATGSAGGEETVCLRDAASGLAVRQLAVSAELRAEENAAILHRYPYYERLERLPQGESRSATCLAFSADGRQLATGGNASCVWLWDAERGGFLGHRGNLEEVSEVVFSPDGRYLAECGSECGPEGGLIRVWDALGGREVQVLCQDTGQPAAPLTPNPDGTTSQKLSWVYCLAFSPDGRWLAAGSRSLVRVWDLTEWKSVAELNPDVDVGCVAFSPDGSQVVLGETDQHRTHDLAVRVWDWRSGHVTVLYGHEGRVTGVAFSPNGRTVASCSEDGTVRFWEESSGEPPPRRPDKPGPIEILLVSPDGRRLVCDNELWGTATGLPVTGGEDEAGPPPVGQDSTSLTAQGMTSSRFSGGGVRDHRSASFSADGQLLAVGTSKGSVDVRDAATGRPVTSLAPRTRRAADVLGHGGPVALSCPTRATAFDNAGRCLGALDYDGNVRIWELRTGAEVAWVPCPQPGAAWPERYETDGRITAALPAWQVLCLPGPGGGEYGVLKVARQSWTVLGTTAHTARLLREGVETAVYLGAGGTPVVWLPAAYDPVALSPDGATVAGAAGRRLHLYALEGTLRAQPLSPADARQLLAEAAGHSQPDPAPVGPGGGNGPFVCPRCGYTFDPRVISEMRQRLLRSPAEGAGNITRMSCRCGLELLAHWPSRLALLGVEVQTVHDRASSPPSMPLAVPPLAPARPRGSSSPPAPRVSKAGSQGLDSSPAVRTTGTPLEQAKALLRAGKAEAALDVLRGHDHSDPEARNAYGVCLLRCGDAEAALSEFSGLIFPRVGTVPLPNAPVRYKVNFAAALLQANRIDDAATFLSENVGERDPAGQRLRSSLANWDKSLTWWQRLLWRLGIQPNKPVELELPLGEI
jgi:WD40 repeat protein